MRPLMGQHSAAMHDNTPAYIYAKVHNNFWPCKVRFEARMVQWANL